MAMENKTKTYPEGNELTPFRQDVAFDTVKRAVQCDSSD